MSSFELVYAVPLECQLCVDLVLAAVGTVSGVERFTVDLALQRVTVEGTAPPSAVVLAIRALGRDAIIRGTGQPNSAAVAILESFDEAHRAAPVRGLARIVGSSAGSSWVDLTVNGVAKGRYYPTIRTLGDLSRGALSTGGVLHALEPVDVAEPVSDSTAVASIGTGNATGFAGQAFLQAPVSVAELVGRSVVLSRSRDGVSSEDLVGVVARSAGAWENDKVVCSCSGKTVWQERADALAKGVV